MTDSFGSTQPVKNKPVQDTLNGGIRPVALPEAGEEDTIDLTRPISPPVKPPKRTLRVSPLGLLRALGMFLVGVVIVLAMAVAGGWFGASSGMGLRYDAQHTLVSGQVSEQYALAMQDLDAGRYSIAATRVAFVAEKDRASISPAEIARLYQQGMDDLLAERYDRAQVHFELVLLLDPNFPGVQGSLSEVMLRRSRTATPTLQFTPTVTPTLDLRGEEELFAQIRTSLNARDWDGTIQAVTNLRNRNFSYRAVEVDGMYFTALRNRGVDRILVRGEPESGIYDLTLAERIGPLDRDADSYRTWARYYITGASFWESDWEKVVYYFEMIYTALPNLRDGSNMTAVERFRIAAVQYADQLAAAGDFCKADEYYHKSLQVNNDPTVQPTRQYAFDRCQQQNQEPPTPEATPILSETPSVTPTVTPTETPTPTTP
ncbi:MAG TPA: hypothetical protein VFF78_07470 [Anaerolineaceae bacterium]|nr:hypothetical protein [Anaerolineaceae bacterium]